MESWRPGLSFLPLRRSCLSFSETQSPRWGWAALGTSWGAPGPCFSSRARVFWAQTALGPPGPPPLRHLEPESLPSPCPLHWGLCDHLPQRHLRRRGLTENAAPSFCPRPESGAGVASLCLPWAPSSRSEAASCGGTSGAQRLRPGLEPGLAGDAHGALGGPGPALCPLQVPSPAQPGQTLEPLDHPSRGPVFSVAADAFPGPRAACWERDGPGGREQLGEDPVQAPPGECVPRGSWCPHSDCPCVLRTH